MLPTSLSPSLLSYSFLFSFSFPLLSISYSKLMNIGTVKSGSELFRKRRLLYPPIFYFLISIDSSLFTHHSDINKKMFDKKMTTSHPMSWGRSNYNSYKCIVSSSLRERTLDLRQLEVVHLMWRVNKRRCRCNAAFDTLYETVDWHFIRIFYQSVI